MRGGVTFEAGGKAYSLRYTTNALCRLEEASGKPIGSLLSGMQDGGMSIATVRLVLWAGVSPAVTVDHAGDMIDELGIDAVSDLITKAMEAAFPEAKSGGNAMGAAA